MIGEIMGAVSPIIDMVKEKKAKKAEKKEAKKAQQQQQQQGGGGGVDSKKFAQVLMQLVQAMKQSGAMTGGSGTGIG